MQRYLRNRVFQMEVKGAGWTQILHFVSESLIMNLVVEIKNISLYWRFIVLKKIQISCSWIFLNNPTVTLKQNITQLRLKGNKMKFTFTVEEFKDKSIVLWQKTSVHWNWSSSSIETDRPVTFIPRWNKMMNGRAGKMDLSPLSMLSAQSLPIEDLQSAS